MDTKDLAMPDITDIVKQFGSMPMIKVKKEQYDRWVNNCMSEKNKTQTSWIYLNDTKKKLHNCGYTLWIQERSKGDVDIRTFLYYDEEEKIDIYDNCKKCGFRIGSHSINESYRCGLIKLKPIYNDFNPKMINLFIKSREKEKE